MKNDRPVYCDKQRESGNENNDLSTELSIEFEDDEENKKIDKCCLSSFKEGKFFILKENFSLEYLKN